MKVRKGFLAAALGIGVMAATVGVQQAEARPVIIVRPSYGFGFYGPAWYGPAWGPTYIAPRRVTGDIKIDTHEKQDMVYVDGGFAGKSGNLKKFSLQPGKDRLSSDGGGARRQDHGHQTVVAVKMK